MFNAIKPRDVLCLYQHARRHAAWLAETRGQFIRAVGLGRSEIKTFRASTEADARRIRLPRDVVMFAAVKPSH